MCGAHTELMQLAAKPKSPIVSALRGREHIQYDNPSGEDYCFSNSALAFVELEMMAAGILGQETELVNSDFVAVARSAGMFGVRVEDPADLKKAVTEAFQHDGPALVDAVVNRTELSMPPTIKLDQAVGFNLWALKAVLNGRGDELIDLAVHSLIR